MVLLALLASLPDANLLALEAGTVIVQAPASGAARGRPKPSPTATRRPAGATRTA